MKGYEIKTFCAITVISEFQMKTKTKNSYKQCDVWLQDKNEKKLKLNNQSVTKQIGDFKQLPESSRDELVINDNSMLLKTVGQVLRGAAKCGGAPKIILRQVVIFSCSLILLFYKPYFLETKKDTSAQDTYQAVELFRMLSTKLSKKMWV